MWNPSSDAAQYAFMLDGGTLTTTASTNFTVNGVSPGGHTAAVTTPPETAAGALAVNFTYLLAPTGVSATGISSSQVKVTWNPVPGATGYVIGCNHFA